MTDSFDPTPVVSSANLGLMNTDELRGDGESKATPKTEVLAKFRQFLREHHDEAGSFPYREQLKAHYVQGTYHLEVDMNDLRSWDKALCNEFEADPADLLPLLEMAAKEVVRRLTVPQPRLEDMPEFQVLLTNYDKFTNLRELSAREVSKLVAVRGIVVSAGKGRVKATKLVIICRNCRQTKVLNCGSGFGHTSLPRRCETVYDSLIMTQKCPLDPFRILPDSSEYIDQQRLKLQENPEHIPTGEMPRQTSLSLERYLVGTVKPGTRVSIIGIYTTYTASTTGRGASAGASMKEMGIRMPYIRVVGIRDESDAAEFRGGKFDPEDEEEMNKISQTPDLYQKIGSSMAPAILGHEDIKKAIACQLFGGSAKKLPDGMRLRGDINLLLLGDPSVGKSQFLKFAFQVAPIGVYTSGKGSSAAGLTASVLRDPSSGDFHLEGGALVLADGGLVCIDEFDKMDAQDRVAIHEAMEQQTISIAKAGITTILNSRTSVLAAANPHWSRYDDTKTAAENIDFQGTILSRFDLIFIVKDIQNADLDRKLAKHVIAVHTNPTAAFTKKANEADSLFFSPETLSKYVAYCRQTCSPRLDDDAAEVLKNRYVGFRKQMRDKKTEEGGMSGPTIPITVRQLEAIVRLSESLARMELSPVATTKHVREAVRLFTVSTLDAATNENRGDPISGSGEFFAKVKAAERFMLERVSLGTTVSTEGLIRQTLEKDFSDSVARAGLDNLCGKQIFRYKNQRRRVEHVGAQ
eukprot:gb/GEZN01002487.1/.p1 GENE.gb/GEZN01002487.1/~~gb/GEZN01002487.1/.p1  ORF type:complete len:750 (+),score=71.07 gb/GEZN01002487.1/:43-2292(+)